MLSVVCEQACCAHTYEQGQVVGCPDRREGGREAEQVGGWAAGRQIDGWCMQLCLHESVPACVPVYLRGVCVCVCTRARTCVYLFVWKYVFMSISIYFWSHFISYLSVVYIYICDCFMWTFYVLVLFT